MYGAIFGDIIGSRFEFDRGGKTKDFELFTDEDNFTDDTVMTIAVAEGLMRTGKDADTDTIKAKVTASMRDWGRRYPHAGYGGRFHHWLFSIKKPEPYGSYGNGSAMRVSAAGWLYDSLERTREVARATAEVTHNHPEGIKGAECTAAVIFMGRIGLAKDAIREYVVREFGYEIRTLEELRPLHEHVETCQDSLPKALAAFFEGESYEDVVRNAVSLGGDTDTIAAIAGSMAEAFHGITLAVMAEGQGFLPQAMLEVLDDFDRAMGRCKEEGRYRGNGELAYMVSKFRRRPGLETFNQLMHTVVWMVDEGNQAPMPMVDVDNALEEIIDMDETTVGGRVRLGRDVRLKIDLMQDSNGAKWVPLFTEMDEVYKGQTANINVNLPFKNILEQGCRDDVEGVVINPFGEALVLTKDIIGKILDLSRKED